MKIILQKVTKDYHGPALSYLLDRLAAFQLHGFPSTQKFDETSKKYAASTIPIVPAEQFPKLTDAESAAIEKSISCAKDEITNNYGLLSGEKTVSEFFSYLAQPYEDIPAGTGVLRQETNFALIYFFFDNTRIEGTKIVFVPPANVLMAPPYVAAVTVASALALSLAQGLLKGIGGKIGALICSEIFQLTDIDYFEPTEAMLTKIVHQEVTQTVVNQINGRVNGTKNWINNTYKFQKQQYQTTPDPNLLLRMQSDLSSFSNDMHTEVIGPLMEDQFAKPGFAVFLIGAGVHFSLYQELALIDNTVTDKNQSAYAKSVASLAELYATFAETTYGGISQSRQAMIYMKYGKRCSSAGGYPVCSEFYYYKDDYTGEYHEYSPGKDETLSDSKAQCQSAMNQHIQAALAQLNTDLGNPNSVIPTWRNLKTQPLPPA